MYDTDDAIYAEKSQRINKKTQKNQTQEKTRGKNHTSPSYSNLSTVLPRGVDVLILG